MTLRVLTADPLKHACDLLAVAVFEGEKKLRGVVADIDKALGGIVASLMKDEGFQGKTNETLLVQTHGRIKPKRVFVIGLGKERDITNTSLREAAALAVKKAKEYAAKTIAIPVNQVARRGSAHTREGASFIVEGALLGSYHYNAYHGTETREEHDKRRATELILLAPSASVKRQLEAGVADGQLRVQSTCFARDLVNAPASDMTPKHLVEVARDIAKKNKRVSLEVFDAAEAKKRGMGAFLAVAKGSEEPPYFIHLSYQPSRKASAGKQAKTKKPQATSDKLKKVFLVGKGVTFDSGGLHVKPWGHMETMKSDMAGGAAVLGVFSEIDALSPRVEVHGLIPCTENMPSGKATKPGDIARALNGKTIEIVNTDAEGRLILADALSFAVKAKADVIIDLATLTGACRVALGEDVAGLFGNNPKLVRSVKDAAESVGELVWELPLVKEYIVKHKSRVADLKNVGDRWGGAIEGGLFLQEFVGETPWVHLDIAGPAFAEKETFPSVPLGGTGFGVRTLIAWLQRLR